MKKLIYILIFLFSANICYGFGISPPYVYSENLMPGSVYEQRISIVRNEIDEIADINVNVRESEVKDWITIPNLDELKFDIGQKQVFMNVLVNVPLNAGNGQHLGAINVSVPTTANVAGGAAVALGALIDVDLTVSGEELRDFVIYSIKIDQAYAGESIRSILGVENKGNIDLQPDKVVIEIYDVNEKNLLDLTEGRIIGLVPANKRKEIEVLFDTKIQQAGAYWAHIKVYKDSEIISDEKIFLSIQEVSAERRELLTRVKNKIKSIEQLQFFDESGNINWVVILSGLAFLLLTIALLTLARIRREKIEEKK